MRRVRRLWLKKLKFQNPEKPVPKLKISHRSLRTHHNATLSMSPSPTVGFGDAGAGGIGAAAAAWAA